MANYQELANLVWNVADDVLRGRLFRLSPPISGY